MQIFCVRTFFRLNFLMALLGAIALTAATLIAFLVHEYQPPDTAAEIEALTP